MKFSLRKRKENGDLEFAPVYFNYTIKTVINIEYNLDKSFQEILYTIDNWINEGSGWMIESTDAEYVNISIFSPLSASSCIELPNELKNSMKAANKFIEKILKKYDYCKKIIEKHFNENI